LASLECITDVQQLLVDRSQLADVMANPACGLAVEEVTSRPKELVRALGALSNQLFTSHTRKTLNYYGHLHVQGCEQTFSSLVRSFPGYEQHIKDVYCDLVQLGTEMCSANNGAVGQTVLTLATGYRHRSNGHVDENKYTLWFGADQPGFFVYLNNHIMSVPSLPENQVLIMR